MTPPPAETQPTDPALSYESILRLFRSQDDFLSGLSSLSILPAAGLLACGIVYLLYGWKSFKVLVVLNAAVIGVMAGAQLGTLLKQPNMPIYMGIGGGLVLGMLAWPTMKYAVSIMGGLAGSLLGYGIWQYVFHATNKPDLVQHAWAGALMGLIFFGLLAFILFRVAIISWTAFQGAIMSVAGVVAMLLKHNTLGANLNGALTGNIHLLPLIVGVPAGIGFIFQDAALVKKEAKKRKKSSAG